MSSAPPPPSKTKLLGRFLSVQSTSDSISSLSLYVQGFDVSIVTNLWFDALRQAPANVLLPLVYLANDILQRARSRGAPPSAGAYIVEFSKYLEPARELSARRAPSQAAALKRVAGVWADREVYSRRFVGVLCASVDRGAAQGQASSASSGGGGGGTEEGEEEEGEGGGGREGGDTGSAAPSPGLFEEDEEVVQSENENDED